MTAVRAGSLVAIGREAIASLDPARLVADALATHPPGPTTLLALGKAAEAMAAGARAALGDAIKGEVVAGPGWGAHPLPDAGSVAAGQALLAAARAAGEGEHVVALISGGGSSLAVGLAPPVTLEDKRAVTRRLLEAGATIDEINVIRRHLSSLKGGWLAEAAAPAALTTLILSDVVSGDLATVASGPTMADPSTFAAAHALASRFGLPARVLEILAAGARGERAETPAAVAGEVSLLADNRTLVHRAAEIASARGLAVRVIDAPIVGEPRALTPAIESWLATPGQLVVAGGETTPRLPASRGRGGRAQQLALVIAAALSARPGSAALVLGSDGVDGPDGGAGGVVTAETAGRLAAAGIDLDESIARFDSATALAAAGAQIAAEPTGTNLADLVLIWTGGDELG